MITDLFPQESRKTRLHHNWRLAVAVTSVTIVIGILLACNTTLELVGPAGPFDELPAWSPDGRYLVHVCYWPDRKDNSGREVGDPYYPVSEWLEICTTDVDSHRRIRITENEQYNYDPSWSPDGSHVAYTGKKGLYVSTPDGVEVNEASLGKQITHYPGLQYAWSPDGLRLSFAAEVFGELGSSNTDLYMVNLSEMKLRQLTDWDGQERDPRWSPTSNRLAFVWFPKDVERNTAQIHVIDVGTGKSEQIIDTFVGAGLEKAAVTDLTWSPDGKLLAFVGSRSSLRSAVYLVDVGTRKLDRITVEMISLYGLTWSPDGSLLAFVGQGPRGVQEIFTMKSNGTEIIQITEEDDFGYGGSFDETRGQRLTWSPDGQYLAFVRDGREQEQKMWIIKADGSRSPEMITGQ